MRAIAAACTIDVAAHLVTVQVYNRQRYKYQHGTMQQRVTEHFRQQKPHTERSARGKKQQALPELPGAHGEGAVTDFDIDAEERVLREFDLATQYGPCTGLTRLERWERAAKFGLNPPLHIRDLLMGPQGDQKNNNIWHGRV